MRKHALAVVALTVVLALTGCGKTTDDNKNNPDASQSSVGTAAESISLNKRDVEKMVTLCDYKNLTVTVSAPSVSDESLEYLLNSVYVGAVTAETGGITDRPVQTGDTAVIDFEGKKDGVAFAGGTSTDYDLEIGSGTFIAGFEDGLIGVMPGETVDLDLTFPENYGNADLAGQAVVFTVKVNFIRPDKVALEDMRDDVVASIGIAGVTTVEEFRTFVSSYMSDSAQDTYDQDVENAIIDALLDGSTFQNLPEDILTTYKSRIIANISQAVAGSGTTADEYCNYYYGLSAAECAAFYGELSLKQDVAIQAIANAEGLNISDDELNTMLESYATMAGMESVEAYLAYIGSESVEDYRGYFLNQKVINFLRENVTIVEE